MTRIQGVHPSGLHLSRTREKQSVIHRPSATAQLRQPLNGRKRFRRGESCDFESLARVMNDLRPKPWWHLIGMWPAGEDRVHLSQAVNRAGHPARLSKGQRTNMPRDECLQALRRTQSWMCRQNIIPGRDQQPRRSFALRGLHPATAQHPTEPRDPRHRRG